MNWMIPNVASSVTAWWTKTGSLLAEALLGSS